MTEAIQLQNIAIIQELIHNFGRLPRTKAVKLLYLLDEMGVKKYQKRCTSFEFYKYHYGPYDDEIIKTLEDSRYFNKDINISYSGNIYYLYNTGITKPNISLDKSVIGLIDELTKKYRGRDLQSILEVVYSSEAFKNTEFRQIINLG